MPPHTVDSLCARLRANPAPSLGARSPTTLWAYLHAYAVAVRCHRVGTLVDELGEALRPWVRARFAVTEEHASRLNAFSPLDPTTFALLRSEDDHEAFDEYLDLRARCAADHGPTPIAPSDVRGFSDGDLTLFDLLALVRARPGMYFGNDRVENCWAVIQGYGDAEADHGVASIATARMRGFQAWVDERYPFGRGQPWFRVFRFLAIDARRGMKTFYDHLDLFMAGAPSDAPDPAEQEMLAAIRRQVARDKE